MSIVSLANCNILKEERFPVSDGEQLQRPYRGRNHSYATYLSIIQNNLYTLLKDELYLTNQKVLFCSVEINLRFEHDLR